MPNDPISLSEAVKHSFLNRAEVEQSESCACFYCFSRFASSEIRLWTDSDDPEEGSALRKDTGIYNGVTAICPKCENDSVIGSASGYDLSDEFLRLLHDYWHVAKPPA
jgi:hypothetical protein